MPPGTLLDAFRLDRLLGEGGMGFVYGAEHVALNRRCAIKMLRPELSQHEQILTRFLNEAKAVNVINHQNIVNVYNYGDWGPGSAYFDMEYLEGETLEDLMQRQLPMPLPLLLHVFGQIAKALSAAHAKQIVHRDLKPGNVFIIAREDNPHFVKLLDFGIAQLRGMGAVEGLTLAGSVLGTPQYMSPEQIGGGVVDARTDVWAMGVMMYRAATGRAAFEGEEFVELADKILHHPPPPAHLVAAVPMGLSQLIEHCLVRQVEHRCRSIDELIAGLLRVKREAGLDHGTVVDEPAHASGSELRRNVEPRPARSKAVRYAVLGAAVIAAVGLGVGLLARPHDVPKKVVVEGPIEPPPPPLPPSYVDLITRKDFAGARKQAEQSLRDEITNGTLQRKGFATEAIGTAHATAGAPMLYDALRSPSADLQVKAAHALGELALPDSAPKLRQALSSAGEKPKTSIAVTLFNLGDKDARPILIRTLSQPALGLEAAIGLADAGDDAGRAMLIDTLATFSPDREVWQHAAHGMIKLGDAATHKRLEGELAQSDGARAVGAAAVLAEATDPKAIDMLARQAADPEFAWSGKAAVALARIGDHRALDWVDRGTASNDADERLQALAILGRLRPPPATYLAVARLADQKLDERVRMTAEAVLLGLRTSE